MRWFTVLALAVAVGLGTAFSPFVSGSPDGLQKVAEKQGFLDRGRLAEVQEEAPAAGYAFPGVEDPRLATALAGFAGTLGVFLVGAGVVVVVRRPRTA